MREYIKFKNEGWGADSQRAERALEKKAWEMLAKKYKSNPELVKMADKYHAKGYTAVSGYQKAMKELGMDAEARKIKYFRPPYRYNTFTNKLMPESLDEAKFGEGDFKSKKEAENYIIQRFKSTDTKFGAEIDIYGYPNGTFDVVADMNSAGRRAVMKAGGVRVGRMEKDTKFMKKYRNLTPMKKKIREALTEAKKKKFTASVGKRVDSFDKLDDAVSWMKGEMYFGDRDLKIMLKDLKKTGVGRAQYGFTDATIYDNTKYVDKYKTYESLDEAVKKPAKAPKIKGVNWHHDKKRNEWYSQNQNDNYEKIEMTWNEKKPDVVNWVFYVDDTPEDNGTEKVKNVAKMIKVFMNESSSETIDVASFLNEQGKFTQVEKDTLANIFKMTGSKGAKFDFSGDKTIYAFHNGKTMELTKAGKTYVAQCGNKTVTSSTIAGAVLKNVRHTILENVEMVEEGLYLPPDVAKQLKASISKRSKGKIVPFSKAWGDRDVRFGYTDDEGEDHTIVHLKRKVDKEESDAIMKYIRKKFSK